MCKPPEAAAPRSWVHRESYVRLGESGEGSCIADERR
jgi:hypothetical protein